MIILNITCPRCYSENNGSGAARFWDSRIPNTIRLNVPCRNCIALQEWAREALRRKGEWLEPEAGLPPPPQPKVQWFWDLDTGEWR